MADIRLGAFLTALYGDEVDLVTGDYSLGAAGFLIEDGQVTSPISEFTIAGNLRDMFRNLSPANDLVFRYGVDAPTVRVDGLTVAGT
jgi:PmbA protein